MIFLKKIISVLSFFCILSLNLPIYSAEISATSAVVIDAESGRVLYEKNASKIMTPASTTKIMTGLLAAEYGRGDEILQVSRKAAYQEGSSMYLKEGERVTLTELLYGLLLSSGNDAAVVLAEHIAGSTELFAKKMTERAREIGAVNTSFKNPNGLDEEGHYTTALDLAKIAAHAMKNELFRKIAGTSSITLQRGTYTNHNKLLRNCEGVFGVKTGFTKKSGRCLVTACERNGFSIITVTLNAPDDWNDHRKLFDETYQNYNKITPFSKGDIVCEITAENGERVGAVCENSLECVLNSEEQKRVEIINDLPPKLYLPVKNGQILGKVKIMLDGNVISETQVLSNRDVLPPPKESFGHFLFITAKSFFRAFM